MFFFSSRRRHTQSLCDWSSKVVSSDHHTAEQRISLSTTDRFYLFTTKVRNCLQQSQFYLDYLTFMRLRRILLQTQREKFVVTPSEARAIRCDAHFKSLQMSDEPFLFVPNALFYTFWLTQTPYFTWFAPSNKRELPHEGNPRLSKTIVIWL